MVYKNCSQQIKDKAVYNVNWVRELVGEVLYLNEKIILCLISDVRKQTLVNEKDHINVVKRKCETREAIAKISFILYKKYLEHRECDIPREISRWEEV